ncbi:hypothetical protein KY361_00950 [Candidatus Woesearchaeota archaeon]|nr:hypothetical protein [Candidatus Woesearchaeota archaeon]
MSFEAEITYDRLEDFLREFNDAGVDPEEARKHIKSFKGFKAYGQDDDDAIANASRVAGQLGFVAATILSDSYHPKHNWQIKAIPHTFEWVKTALEQSGKPLGEVLYEMFMGRVVPVVDMHVRRFLDMQVAVLKGEEDKLHLLVRKEFEKLGEDEISAKYIPPEERNQDSAADFDELLRRILVKELRGLYNKKTEQRRREQEGSEVKNPDIADPTMQDFLPYYEKALGLAHVLLPHRETYEARRKAGIDEGIHKWLLERSRVIYTPLQALKAWYKGVRHLNPQLLEAEVSEITNLRESVLGSNQNPEKIRERFRKAMRNIRDNICTTWLKTEYNGSDEQKQKVKERIYHSLLLGLELESQMQFLKQRLEQAKQGEQLYQEYIKSNIPDNVTAEIRKAREAELAILPAQIATLQAKLDAVPDPTDPELAGISAQISNLEAQLDDPVPEPTIEQLEGVRKKAVSEITTLFGPGAADYLEAQGIDEIGKAYRMQAHPAEEIWDVFSPLCRGLQFLGESSNDASITGREPATAANSFIQTADDHIKAVANYWKIRDFITEAVFKKSIDHTRQGLQEIYLSSGNSEGFDGRYRYYAFLGDALPDPEGLAAKIRQPRNPIRADRDYAAQETCRRYLDGDITRERATESWNILQGLREDELAHALLFDDVLNEFENMLQTQAGGREPTQNELRSALHIAVEKASVLMPGVASSLETKYRGPKGIKQLIHDYKKLYRHEALIGEQARRAGAATLQEVLEHVYPIVYVEFWRGFGDERPPPEHFYWVHDYAMSFARKAMNKPEQPNQPADAKEQKRFWAKHLHAYQLAVRAHKKELKHKHKIGPAEEIEEYHKRPGHRSLAERLVGHLYWSVKIPYTKQTLGFRWMTEKLFDVSR